MDASNQSLAISETAHPSNDNMDSVHKSDNISATLSTRRERKLFEYLKDRRIAAANTPNALPNILKNHLPFLDQLDFVKKLPVHTGCVNTIHWNETGEYILSGSDDKNLCITKPTNLLDGSKGYTVLSKIQTHHLGNIFSARFLPNTSDMLTISCSTHGPVKVHEINSEDPTKGLCAFNCHMSTIFDVVPIKDERMVFLSCSEDATVRLFDLRCHRSCARPGTCPHPALIRNSDAVTTLSINPINSNLLLLGRADGMGLVYDRRKLPDVAKFSREKAHADRIAGNSEQNPALVYRHPMDGAVSKFLVPDMNTPRRFASLCYSPLGDQVLASYLKEDVYLFNHDRSSNFELQKTCFKGKKSDDEQTPGQEESSGISDHPSRVASRKPDKFVRKIRFRGDWSDTGINSVPSSRRGNASAIDSLASRLFRASNLRINDRPPSFSYNVRDSTSHNAREAENTTENVEDSSDSETVSESDRNEIATGASQLKEDKAEVDILEPKKHDRKPQISEETKMKFRRATESLRNRFSQIPCYRPCKNYFGHRNSRTMIKEANFWGDNFIMSGSDCGRIFFWEKKTGSVVTAFQADENVVNRLAPHPHHYLLASSGIDCDIKLWSTQFLLECPMKPDSKELQRIIDNNELMLEEARNTITVPPHLFFRFIASLSQRDYDT